MIIYLDTSVLARALLPDEAGHDDALALLDDPAAGLVTGSWARIELASALTRAARLGRIEPGPLVDAGLALLGDEGRITVVSPPQDQVESAALDLVLRHGLRAMDAWHLACAGIVLPILAESDEAQLFATRDRTQADAARALGLAVR